MYFLCVEYKLWVLSVYLRCLQYALSVFSVHFCVCYTGCMHTDAVCTKKVCITGMYTGTGIQVCIQVACLQVFVGAYPLERTGIG